MSIDHQQGVKITLYWLNESRAQRIVWLLEELNLEYEVKVYKRGKDMRAPLELKDVHPLGKAPVIGIQAPGAEKPIIIAESGAIVEYLCEHFGSQKLIPKRYPEGKEGIVGAETEQFMRYRYLMHYAEGSFMTILVIALVIHNIKNAPVPFFIKPITRGIGNKVEQSFVNPGIVNNLAFLEDYLATSPDNGEFFCGNLSGADFMMIFALEAAMTRQPLNDGTNYPKLYNYVKKIQARDAYNRAGDRITEVTGERHMIFPGPWICVRWLCRATIVLGNSIRTSVHLPSVNINRIWATFGAGRELVNESLTSALLSSDRSGAGQTRGPALTPKRKHRLSSICSEYCQLRVRLAKAGTASAIGHAIPHLERGTAYLEPFSILDQPSIQAINSPLQAPGRHLRLLMPDQPGPTTSRDFAFQSTDQSFAHPLGAGDNATSSTFRRRSHDRYDAEGDTNAASASSSANPAASQDNPLRFPDFSGQQAQGQFPTYGFSPGGPLVWDWNNSIEFPDFTNHYEPQGELVQELQNQGVPTNDFTIPLPVTTTDTIYQSPQPVPNGPPTNAQNPLSPPPKPASRPALQTGMKRKAESEPNSAVSQSLGFSTELQQNPAKRQNKSRSSSLASATSPVVAAVNDIQRSSMTQATATAAATEPTPQTNSHTNNETQRRKELSKGTGPQGRVIDVSRPRKIVESPGGHDHLPAGKVFPIQIGSELFRLSGASLSSDAPSYFTHFFGEQLHNNQGRAGDLRTLYIDRDPETFRDIALHLQGYHIVPRDGEHFVRLFADAQFYSLPRLTKQLFKEDIFIRIGGTPFQIPRDLFNSPGDSPNYFSLGFAQFFSTPTEVFPGLDRNALLRPPSISPPRVPHKSGVTFMELVRMLQGYKVEIRNEEHRSQLLRDARYFHLKGLEQRLIPCEISYNLKRNQSEILIRLEDIRQSGVSFTPDIPPSNSNSGSGSAAASVTGRSPAPECSKPSSPAPSLSYGSSRAGSVCYARPYTDDNASTSHLILEISSSESTTLQFPTYAPMPSSSDLRLNLRATFHASTLARITSLFSVIASKMGLPATQPLGLMMLSSGSGIAGQPVSPANSGVSERRVRVRLQPDCYIEIDGSSVELDIDTESGRLGVKRVETKPRTKRVRISEDRYEHDGNVEVKKSEWIWGGAKKEDLRQPDDHEEEWIIKRAHWRLRVEPVDEEAGRMQVVLCGVRIEGFSVERSRNRDRGFLER
ncbi:hypothetical protein CC78DRAFT_614957 [Lojkania enalia]|uniref:glutathione transferase n=1 Tax=Lojkania enalia TaxID=147567 RepID=A0A9P4KBX7_9PLEO|nr:hypothetical protein CC78DRAFT_614957 [Didymosphaeria enalia]